MSLKQKVKTRLKEIEEDNRYQRDDVAVQINAPLAMVQVDLKARHSILKWVLDELEEEA